MYYIGVDAGGTKTHTILSDGNTILCEARSGAANRHVVGWEEAVHNIIMSIEECIAQQNAKYEQLSICVGMAGANNPQDQREARKRISGKLTNYNVVSCQLHNDTIIALESGTTQRNAIALVCGTGSNCYGRNVEGEEAWVSGLDYILSDEASGYMIGLEALKSATKSMDGRINKTLIETEVYKQLKVLSMKEAATIIYEEKWKKSEIARMAICVFYAAQQGDKKALEIVEKAVEEAILMVQSAARKLKMSEFALVTVGGLFSERVFLESFNEKIKTLYPSVNIVQPKLPPAWGAVVLAKETTT